MSSPLEEVPFTELIQHPTRTTGRLTGIRALRLLRRDASDLVLMSADRAQQDGEVIDLTARLLAEWRHTAEVYADPELHAILTLPHEGDFGPVPAPDPAA
jgi:hypothetical protein